MSRGGTLIVRGLQASIHAAWILVILAMKETGVLSPDAPSNGAPVKFGRSHTFQTDCSRDGTLVGHASAANQTGTQE
jgi:hypothetical protein